jgi:hypothetical protein
MNTTVPSSTLLHGKKVSGKYGGKSFSAVTEVLWRQPCLIRIKRCGSTSRIVPLVSPDRGCCSIKNNQNKSIFFQEHCNIYFLTKTLCITHVLSQKYYFYYFFSEIFKLMCHEYQKIQCRICLLDDKMERGARIAILSSGRLRSSRVAMYVN